MKTYNAKTGHQLAVQQDGLIARYNDGESLSDLELKDLKNNLWVKTAKHLAPSNLVLRQWALIDLFSKSPDNAGRILEMVDLLSYGPSEERLWSEGYSYWLYTRSVLAPWVEAFKTHETALKVKGIMEAVDLGFAVTAYDRNGTWFPAPFGDLRDHPLLHPAHDLRNSMTEAKDPASHAFLTVAKIEGGFKYIVQGSPIGLNSHIANGTETVEVKNGMPEGFKFYQGYDKKYAGPGEEKKDMLHPARIKSIETLKLRSKFK